MSVVTLPTRTVTIGPLPTRTVTLGPLARRSVSLLGAPDSPPLSTEYVTCSAVGDSSASADCLPFVFFTDAACTGSSAATASISASAELLPEAAGACSASATVTGAAVLAMSAAGACTAAATLGGSVAAVCTAAGVATQAATLTGEAAVVGTSAGVGTQSATLRGSAAVIVAAAGVAIPSATLRGSAAASCTAAGVATPSAALRGTAAVAGTSAGVATQSATLLGIGALAMSSAGACAVSATGNYEKGILDLSPYSFIEADYYSVDGVTGKTASLIDKVAAGTGIRAITANHAFVQATSANQCAVPAVDASFNGARSINFTGTQYYQSNAPASAFRHLHDGTGMCVVHVFMPTSNSGVRMLESTVNSHTAALPGIFLYHNALTMILECYGTATGTVQILPGSAGALTLNTATYIEQNYVEGGSPFEGLRYVKSTLAHSLNSTGVPYLLDPSTTLMLGAYGDTAGPTIMRWCARIALKRAATTADHTAIRAYITSKYGIT